jgi:hypothetical protein
MVRAFAIIAAALLALPALAQEEDADVGPAAPQCETSINWRVIATELSDTPGMAMDLNKRDASGQPDCKAKNVKPEFTIGGPAETLWFTALSADYLVLFRSNDPVGSLIIQNLGDKTIAVDALSDDSQADSWGVTYWEQREPATKDNCDQLAEFAAQDFTAVIKHEMRFDYATKTKLASGKTKCEPRMQ